MLACPTVGGGISAGKDGGAMRERWKDAEELWQEAGGAIFRAGHLPG